MATGKATTSPVGSAAYKPKAGPLLLSGGLKKPEAKSVVLACSLDGFEPRLARNVAGRWEVTLPADEAFNYFYRVDGVPFLPDCPMKENDDFGSENCIFDPHL